MDAKQFDLFVSGETNTDVEAVRAALTSTPRTGAELVPITGLDPSALTLALGDLDADGWLEIAAHYDGVQRVNHYRSGGDYGKRTDRHRHD